MIEQREHYIVFYRIMKEQKLQCYFIITENIQKSAFNNFIKRWCEKGEKDHASTETSFIEIYKIYFEDINGVNFMCKTKIAHIKNGLLYTL